MKTRYILLLLFPLLALLLQGCLKDQCTSTRTFVRFDPVYKTAAECRADLQVQAPRPMVRPGKIYALGSLLLINEQKEGLHVLDNSNPEAPVQTAFWSIPGNVDMAIRGNYLYVDQYMDLLSIDISDLQSPRVVCRMENEFGLHGFDPYRGYLIDYLQTEVTEEISCDDARVNRGWFRNGEVLFLDAGLMNSSEGASLPAQAGIAGSFSRFGLSGPWLYTIDRSDLRSYNLSNPECPSKTDQVTVGWEIETLFPWKNKLFIGSQSAVYVFDNSDPARPVLETTFWHATGCDPVVCDDNYAYVTLHDGTTCNGTLNQLLVIGIEHLPQTALLATYNMKRPLGLAVNGQYLYLCDDGLKVFDKQNPTAMQQIAHVQNIKTYDVIALDATHLLVIGEGGFYQYDVSTPSEPKQISFIPVQP